MLVSREKVSLAEVVLAFPLLPERGIWFINFFAILGRTKRGSALIPRLRDRTPRVSVEGLVTQGARIEYRVGRPEKKRRV